ncbi:MAG TPA: cytochrome P460 family protein [Thermoanaerobaculia bacterium]|nr:cytochrome P460 family protein [Thermoanaerobaculia bacterium]
MPRELAMACAPHSMSLDDPEKKYGPHAMRWVRVYANESAAAAMRKEGRTRFPAGSILAKEKLVDREGEDFDAVAFMVKHEEGKFEKSGGWEFLFYPAPEGADAYDGCVTCHRVGAKRDYVFGTFEDEESND